MGEARKERLIEQLIQIAEELEWNIAFKEVGEAEIIHGLIMGTPEYILECLAIHDEEYNEAMDIVDNNKPLKRKGSIQ